jgi:hypothetical protein
MKTKGEIKDVFPDQLSASGDESLVEKSVEELEGSPETLEATVDDVLQNKKMADLYVHTSKISCPFHSYRYKGCIQLVIEGKVMREGRLEDTSNNDSYMRNHGDDPAKITDYNYQLKHNRVIHLGEELLITMLNQGVEKYNINLGKVYHPAKKKKMEINVNGITRKGIFQMEEDVVDTVIDCYGHEGKSDGEETVHYLTKLFLKVLEYNCPK